MICAWKSIDNGMSVMHLRWISSRVGKKVANLLGFLLLPCPFGSFDATTAWIYVYSTRIVWSSLRWLHLWGSCFLSSDNSGLLEALRELSSHSCCEQRDSQPLRCHRQPAGADWSCLLKFWLHTPYSKMLPNSFRIHSFAYRLGVANERKHRLFSQPNNMAQAYRKECWPTGFN